MKNYRLKFLILSMPAAVMLLPYSAVHAALRVNNSSITQAQIQAANAMREMAAATQINAPQVAHTITDANGNTTTISSEQMDACNAIYPGGTFDWTKPTTGMKSGSGATCSALVELRSYNGGTSYTVLATGYVAAGDAVKCNIDEFPNITATGREFTYPADEPPTVEDVEKVMAQENKSNAGFKILAAAVVGGLGGNLVGKGDDGFGINNDKLKTTAIGAASGVALMTASTQVNDYKVGSAILSTGMNAAAGAVAGNVMASGEEVLQIDNCKIDGSENEKCLYGTIAIGSSTDVKSGEKTFYFYDYNTNNSYECTLNSNNKYESCRRIVLSNLTFNGISDCKDSDVEISKECKGQLEKQTGDKTFKLSNEETPLSNGGTLELETDNNKGAYIMIETAKTAGTRKGAMIKLADSTPNNVFGYKSEDWRKRNTNKSKLKVDNKLYDLYGKEIPDADINKFSPAYKSASDGSVIDFNNAARTKSTMIGAGAGGALGALSGVSGANAAIQERYLTAVREYEDSLGNVACYTGNRYLSRYNDTIVVPAMKISE
ncbi:MAG: hypothetical protein MJ164_03335 [Alphaproteobacteria bacterium]|nr:hypothetical protein [Alphaproteobacteria bacterium]